MNKLSQDQRGFTLIELLISFGIMSVLAAISLSAFWVYKQDVEYAKATNDLRNARTAIEITSSEASSDAAMGFTFSGTEGGNVEGDLAGMLPGGATSPDVRVGAMFRGCASPDAMTMTTFIAAQPCKADRYTSYIKWCNGMEILQQDLAWAPAC